MKLTQVKTGMEVDAQMLRILTPANKGQLAGAAERLVAAGILSRKEQLAYYREMRIREKRGWVRVGRGRSGPIGRLVTEEEDLLKSIRGFGQQEAS